MRHLLTCPSNDNHSAMTFQSSRVALAKEKAQWSGTALLRGINHRLRAKRFFIHHQFSNLLISILSYSPTSTTDSNSTGFPKSQNPHHAKRKHLPAPVQRADRQGSRLL